MTQCQLDVEPLGVSRKKDVSKRSSRYELLDACRGAACLAIVVYHATLFQAMSSTGNPGSDFASKLLQFAHRLNAGVPIFFVISGYCIAATADSTRRKNEPTSQYFKRRFRRIFPPYWVVLVASVLIIGIVDTVVAPRFISTPPREIARPWWLSLSQWIGNFTLTETWRHQIFGGNRCILVGQAWTLCYEEQFYAVVGATLFFFRKRFFLAIYLLSATCLAIRVFAFDFAISYARGFFFDGFWLLFALGLLVYSHVNMQQGWLRRLVALVLIGSTIAGFYSNMFPQGFLVAAVFAVALIVLRPWEAAIARSGAIAFFNWCGVRCYSIYLVHGLLVEILAKALFLAGIKSSWLTLLVTIPSCMVVSLYLGDLFYHFVERHFLNTTKISSKAAAVELSTAGNEVEARPTLAQMSAEL